MIYKDKAPEHNLDFHLGQAMANDIGTTEWDKAGYSKKKRMFTTTWKNGTAADETLANDPQPYLFVTKPYFTGHRPTFVLI